ncbi:hypothetical protein PC129_g13139 [Phytophthora cactorum]|uniref:Uncharacterized protein n=1 Tax=Phytophthora cactorum TaxID=29920 RepID=A0A8T1HVW9_9STRA|nr:hypothetical protein PC113_g16302 [Phytophthora cactorum]KAG2892047.1 hypothetical protein PC114_g16748 [Phytophthora cactorum]KAG2921467.1 hypothetical protein PC117_g16230 [Phytophthora cactorum]KAG2973173.1 hypothetical protein PC118_g15286 [Phytophthora cactorum]KAG2996676.1 hypothetical protein PC119_g17817 [Phytophthora cactorum]
MKGSTGIQLHHSYVKPGCKVRGGKQGVDYFNGEGTLLAFVRSDKELCARPNISNIMFVICLRKKPRLDPAALVLVFQKISSAKKASDLSKKAAPPSKKSTTPATRTANSSAKAPVWGHQNTTASDGKAAEPPRDSSPRPPPRPEGNAGDVIATPAHAEMRRMTAQISRSVSVRTTTQLHQLPEVVPRIVLVSSTVRRLMITAVVSHSTTLVMKLMDPNLRRKAKMMKGKGMAQTKNRRTTACTKGPQMTLFRFCATLTVIRNFDSTTSMRLIRILRAHKAGLSLIRTAKAMKTRQTRMETTPGTGTDECKPEIIHRELPRVADLMNDVIGIY